MKYAVFAPATVIFREALGSLDGIATGSAIVGHDDGSGRVRIWYEGNVYGATNLNRFAERVQNAVERAEQDYPTSASRYVPRDELVKVGEWHGGLGRVFLTEDAGHLLEWFGVELLDPEQLVLR